MPARIENIVFDARDPIALGHFWAAALELPIAYQAEDEVDVRIPIGDDYVDLCMAPAAHPTPRPHRMHLDLYGAEQQAATVERLLSLGARHLDIGQHDVPWVVLADPEDNAFCVMEHRDIYADTGPIAAVPIDAPDPFAAAAFWQQASSWNDITNDRMREHGYAALRHPSGQGFLLEFCPEPEPKSDAKNPIHLDLKTTDESYDATLQQLFDLGARRLEHDWGDLPWTPLIDPADNEFCLLRG
jgi:hypothetical protein